MTTNRCFHFLPSSLILLSVGASCSQSPHVSLGQEVAVAIESTVIVEGRVSNVYQSGGDSLVQIMVQKSEIPRLERAGHAQYPAPGQYVYVHVGSSKTTASRFGRRAASTQPPNSQLPKSQSLIQAYLTMDNSGQWAPDGQDWFGDAASAAARSTAQRGSIGGANSDGGGLGLTTRRVAVGRENGLAVVSVVPNSPAARAGIEKGDVLVQANGAPLESEDQLLDAYRRGSGQFSLTVRDVRSGRDVKVDVEASGANPTVARNAPMRSLGVKTSLAFFGGEPALKVDSVDAGSRAERAGITEGLLILQANGKAVSSPEELQKVEIVSRGRLELRIVDPKDKRERTVRVGR